jgi:hypothetical protein
MALKSKIVDEWFKSIKFTPGADKDENNVELIDIKVAPIADLIMDRKVAALYNAMVGKHVDYETNVMPRVRKKVYAEIPVSELKLTAQSVSNQVVVDHEVIGEILNEHVHNVEYTVFYPTLGGKVCHEGLGRRCSDDSLFTITWQYLEGQEEQAKAYVTPLTRLNYDDRIYYNNGEIDIAPADDATSYTSNISVGRGAIYMWNDTCVINMKVGPYFLQQGVMANTSDKKEAMNTVRTLLKDVPVGYQLVDTIDLNTIVRFMYKSGEVFASDQIEREEVPSFFSYKRFILKDPTSNQYNIFNLIPGKLSVDPMPGDSIGQALLLRKRDFKHM